jgi:hypothetical protein
MIEEESNVPGYRQQRTIAEKQGESDRKRLS